MDVRCEKCLTEYELDESKVTAAGVTVKCTNCGNLFKIKRRAASVPPPVPASVVNGDDRMWMLRSPDGDVLRFRELTTLQQWIVEQRVSRDHEISRTGDTWKRLGEIAELATFFQVVDQAQAARMQRPEHEERLDEADLMPAEPPPAAEVTRRVPAEDMQAMAEADPDAPSWDTLRAAPPPSSSGPPSSRADSGNEPAWAAGGATAMLKSTAATPDGRDGELEPSLSSPSGAATAKVSPGVFDDVDYEPPPPRRNWFLPVAVIVVAGGVAGIWLAVAGSKKGDTVDTQPSVTPLPQVAVVPDATPPPVVNTGLVEGLAKLAEDTDAAFAEAEKKLESAHVADPAADAKVWAALALVNATWAQALADDAAATDDAVQAKELTAEAERRLIRAEKFAKEAADRAPTAPETLLAQAEVLRQRKANAADIDKKLAGAGDSAEALYARGMWQLQQGHVADAEKLFGAALVAREHEGGSLPRARMRLARSALDAKRLGDARTQVDAVLAAAPGHARAQAMKKKIEQAAAPPPPAEPTPPPRPQPRPTAPEPSEPPTVVKAENYEGLVLRADKLAENGDCSGAMRYYEKALDARPGGVEALTGIGYCYLDRKDYGKAVSNFRAALGISPRYGEALIGMAEAHRFQGKKEEAAEYYRRYLERNPNGSKAAMARRFLEEMGGAPPPRTEPEPKPPEPKPEPPKPEPETKPPAEPSPEAPDKPPPPPPPPPERLPDKPPETIPEAPSPS